jgi:hypothetical protein
MIQEDILIIIIINLLQIEMIQEILMMIEGPQGIMIQDTRKPPEKLN